MVLWSPDPLLPTHHRSFLPLFSIFVSLWVWHLWCVWCVSVGFGSSAGSCSSSAGAPAVTDNQSSTSVWKNLTPFLTQSSFNSDMLDFLTWTARFQLFHTISVGLCWTRLFQSSIFNSRHGRCVFLRGCWSWLRPLSTTLMIPADMPQHISEASLKHLFALHH